MSWHLDHERDRMLGHDFPGVCSPAMHDFTMAEAELGARAAYELDAGSQEQALEALEGLVWESGQHPEDYGTCPYYAYFRDKGPLANCTRGCWEEPRCVTSEPEGGWPSARLAGIYEEG